MCLIILIIALLFATPALAEDIGCPQAIEVAPQSLAKEVSGWRVFFDKVNTHTALEGVTFYSEEPEKLASLVPDISDKNYSEWVLYNNGKQKYFISCSYSNTSVQLTRELPAALKSCRVTFDINMYTPNGLPSPKTIACK